MFAQRSEAIYTPTVKRGRQGRVKYLYISIHDEYRFGFTDGSLTLVLLLTAETAFLSALDSGSLNGFDPW